MEWKLLGNYDNKELNEIKKSVNHTKKRDGKLFAKSLNLPYQQPRNILFCSFEFQNNNPLSPSCKTNELSEREQELEQQELKQEVQKI